MRDVFISYASTDVAAVEPFERALRERGVSTWFDQRDLPYLTSTITRKIRRDIADSRLTLAFWSPAYQGSEACRFEALQSLIAGGLDRLRLVVLEGEPPRLDLLRENLYAQRTPPQELAELVEVVLAGQAPGDQLIGSWQPAPDGFVGRFAERLAAYSALTAHLGASGSSVTRFDRLLIHGFGGQGKTMLAQQIAQDLSPRFVHIERMDAGADQFGEYVDESGQADVMRSLLRQQQAWVKRVAGTNLDLGADDVWDRTRQAAQDLVAQADGHVLWIVDDLPDGLTAANFERLLCPGGSTLVTSRRQVHKGQFAASARIALDSLAPTDCVYLLADGDEEMMGRDGQTLTQIGEAVDGHALSVAVLAQRLATDPAAEVLDDLTRAVVPSLEDAAAFVTGLPTDHKASILATLRMSVESLQAPVAREVLRCASVWPAAKPVPRSLLRAVVGDGFGTGVSELVAANLARTVGLDKDVRVHAQIAGVCAWLDAEAVWPGGADLRARIASWIAAGPLDDGDVWSKAEWGAVQWHVLEPIRDTLDLGQRVMAIEALLHICRVPMTFNPPPLSGMALANYYEDQVALAAIASELAASVDEDTRIWTQAMRGLLLMNLAGAHPDSDEALRFGEQGRDVLTKVLAARIRRGSSQELVTRARFNLGRLEILGRRYALAGQEAAAEQCFQQSLMAYGQAAAARVVSNEPPGNLASCYRGAARVHTVRALCMPGLARADRLRLLEQAQVQLGLSCDQTLRVPAPGALVATSDQTKDLADALRIELIRLHLTDREIDYSLTLEQAQRLAGPSPNWVAVPSVCADCLENAYSLMARLIVNQSRGGRGQSADWVVRRFLESDLPTLQRVMGLRD